MAESTDAVKLSLRLLIDEEKNKVVMADSGNDFVDVLFSLLTLPMGTIVRLLEKHRKSPQVVVGCFNNLYKSVLEMGLEYFQNEACKEVLLFPRSVNHDNYRKIKLKIDDTKAIKYFVSRHRHCRSVYSISNTENCGCGTYKDRGLMNLEIQVLEEEQDQGRMLQKDNGGVFVNCKASSFIITDDLQVVPSSMDFVLNTLKGLGYTNSYKLGEILVDVGFSEVLTLLECLFTSDSALTDTFLKKQSSLRINRSSIPPSPAGDGSAPGQTITFKAFVRKQDWKILCVECGSDFIDLLFTFLALPLESVWDTSGDNISLGCIGNLFRSYKSLNEGTDASSYSKSQLPSFYSCPKQLLDVVTEKREIYYCFKSRYNDSYVCRDNDYYVYDIKYTRKMPDCLNPEKKNNPSMENTNERDYAEALDLTSFGFMVGHKSFLVTDDLVIKPTNMVSNISLLKLKMNLEKENVAEQVITIGKLEATNLLRASVITSSALTTCFWNLISKKA